MASTFHEINHNDKDLKDNKSSHVIAHYHAEVADHQQPPKNNQQPIISGISKRYNLSGTTLGCNIWKSLQKTMAKVHDEQKLLKSIKEKVLVERLLF